MILTVQLHTLCCNHFFQNFVHDLTKISLILKAYNHTLRWSKIPCHITLTHLKSLWIVCLCVFSPFQNLLGEANESKLREEIRSVAR